MCNMAELLQLWKIELGIALLSEMLAIDVHCLTNIPFLVLAKFCYRIVTEPARVD